MESQKIHSELYGAIEDLHRVNIEEINADVELVERIKEHIFHLSTELFKISKEENYFWDLCSFSVYERHYLQRFQLYLEQNDNLIFDEINFIQQELSTNSLLLKSWFIACFNPEIVEELKSMVLKKEHFLNQKLSQITNQESSEPDYDLGKITAKEKMIYLHQLGVIDYLLSKQPFRSTANSLAGILASILEEKPKTIQPILSAIVSGNEVNKNHPLYTKSTLEKVNKQLINIGFNPNQTN